MRETYWEEGEGKVRRRKQRVRTERGSAVSGEGLLATNWRRRGMLLLH
jgi:hypothetical protein